MKIDADNPMNYSCLDGCLVNGADHKMVTWVDLETLDYQAMITDAEGHSVPCYDCCEENNFANHKVVQRAETFEFRWKEGHAVCERCAPFRAS